MSSHELSVPSAQETATRPGRVRRFAGKLALIGTLFGGATGLAAAATPAEAAPGGVSCYGDYCSGQYANATGCDRDAQTLDIADVTQEDYELGLPFGLNPNGPAKVGTIELRYSPTCKTKWARFSSNVTSEAVYTSVTQDTGYTQSRSIGGFDEQSPPGISDSPMIYSPNDAVHAYVSGRGITGLNNTSTAWK